MWENRGGGGEKGKKGDALDERRVVQMEETTRFFPGASLLDEICNIMRFFVRTHVELANGHNRREGEGETGVPRK